MQLTGSPGTPGVPLGPDGPMFPLKRIKEINTYHIIPTVLYSDKVNLRFLPTTDKLQD